MLLSADVFDGVLSAMDPAAAAGSAPTASAAASAATGQRRGPRIPLRSRLTIIPCPEGIDGPRGFPLAVPVRDLSRGGVRFLLPRRLPLDTQFILLLQRAAPHLILSGEGTNGGAQDVPPRRDPAGVIAVASAVIYWQPIARDLFAIGGQFSRLLDDVALPDVTPRVVLPGYEEASADGQRAAS